MSYHVTINGIPVKCDTAAEAFEIARFAAMNRPNKKESGTSGRRSSKSAKETSEATRPSNIAKVRDLLTTIRRAGDSGITGQELAEALKFETPSAMASLFTKARQVLAENNFNANQVFSQQRKGNVRSWVVGEKIDEALARIDTLAEGDEEA